MAEQVGFELHGQRSGAEDPLLQANAQHRLRAHGAVEEEGVAEWGIDHLAAPGGDGPGLRMPVRNRRQQGGAGHGRQLRWRCGRLRNAEDPLHVIQVYDAINVIEFTLVVDQAVAQRGCLKQLGVAGETNGSPRKQGLES